MRRMLTTGSNEMVDVMRGRSPAHLHLRSRIGFLVALTLIIDVVATVLVYYLERDAPGTEITSLGDAAFWTTTQLLTVSSQLSNPITTPARILDVFLQAYAISGVAVLAGSFGSFFHFRSMERHRADESAAEGSVADES